MLRNDMIADIDKRLIDCNLLSYKLAVIYGEKILFKMLPNAEGM